MENASKALIIAGAILLAILIISLGILIYNQAAGVINENAMSQVEIQQFNSQFTQYEGTRVRGATVRTMLSMVAANNTSQDDASRQVVVKLNTEVLVPEEGTTVATTKIMTGAIYKVECKMSNTGADKGLVNEIIVTKV